MAFMSRMTLGALQRATIPAAQVGGRLIGRLRELEQCCIGRRRQPHGVIRQDEFRQIVAVEGGGWSNARRRESGRLRIRVGIERGVRYRTAAGPESAAADFV